MFEPYKNQADVDAAIALARTVFPDANVTSYLLMGMHCNVVSVITITVPQKGNKKKIEELARLGFKIRGKRATNSRINWYTHSAPYSFVVDLEYKLPEYKEEA